MARILMNNVFAVLVCVLVPVLALAEPTYDEQGDLIRPNAKKYEGTLNGIGEAVRGVVAIVNINDTNYSVDEDTIYRNGKGRLTSISSFSQGMYVEYYAIDTLVTKMMVSATTAEQEDQVQPESPIRKSSGGDLRLENGVWKN